MHRGCTGDVSMSVNYYNPITYTWSDTITSDCVHHLLIALLLVSTQSKYIPHNVSVTPSHVGDICLVATAFCNTSYNN